MLPAVCPWAGHLSPTLSLLICKVGVIVSAQPSTQGFLETIKMREVEILYKDYNIHITNRLFLS